MEHGMLCRPRSPRVYVDVVGASLLTLEHIEMQKPLPSSSPTAGGLKAVDGGCFLSLFWLALILVITNNRWSSTIVFQRLIDSWSKMYPLLHRRAGRKSRFIPRPSFEALAVDPLAIVVIEKDIENLELEEGEFVPPALEAFGEDGVAAEVEVKEQGLVLVELEVSPPLSILHHEVRPLMLQFVSDNPRG
ncbi:hypothetical protein AMTR_s00041p00100070 [Amborella trichopoda]|uniref:Uncharacterized protein n=1 Tax=Amborella trichopoda TaxID=13333 RepID=W1Q0A4_AMBTC|nr:hypothetical protein AMTR_s00041p00100070 [Amborella trichopoda]